MATRKMVPRADDEGGIGTALKRWASAFINALTANSITVSDLAASLPVFTDANKKLATIVLPKFSANKNAVNQTGIVSAVQTKITFGTEAYNVGSTYNNANSRWVPGIVGHGHIDATVLWTTAVDQSLILPLIFKNGSLLFVEETRASGTEDQASSMSRDVLITAVTDYFEIYAYQDSGSDKIISGDINHTVFSGHMLP